MSIPEVTVLRTMRSALAKKLMERPDFVPFFERVDSDCQKAEMIAAEDHVALARRRVLELSERA